MRSGGNVGPYTPNSDIDAVTGVEGAAKQAYDIRSNDDIDVVMFIVAGQIAASIAHRRSHRMRCRSLLSQFALVLFAFAKPSREENFYATGYQAIFDSLRVNSPQLAA
jgi:hypothetical protein